MKMSGETFAAAGGLLIVAFCVGWLISPGETSDAASADASVIALPHVRHAGAAAGEARARFVSLGYGRSESYLPAAGAVPPPPPPPDIAVVFRRDLTAIERTPQGPVVWVVDLTQFSGRKGLKPGDAYRDGWKVSAITPQFIELRKRREIRRVSAFDLPQDETP